MSSLAWGSKESSIQEVRAFLKEVRKLAADPRSFILIKRNKNMAFITKYGIQPRVEILNLRYQDYVSGPDYDKDEDGEVWKFSLDFEEEAYVKLKIDERGCVCISFHEAKWPQRCPYRNR